MENLVKAQEAVKKAHQMYIEYQKETQKIKQALTDALQEFATKNQIYKIRLYAMGEENSLASSMHIGMEYKLYCYDVSEARVHPKSEDFVLLQRLCGAMSELSEEVLYNDESIVVYGTNK